MWQCVLGNRGRRALVSGESFQCCFTSTETPGLIGAGSPARPPPLSHSSGALANRPTMVLMRQYRPATKSSENDLPRRVEGGIILNDCQEAVEVSPVADKSRGCKRWTMMSASICHRCCLSHRNNTVLLSKLTIDTAALWKIILHRLMRSDSTIKYTYCHIIILHSV